MPVILWVLGCVAPDRPPGHDPVVDPPSPAIDPRTPVPVHPIEPGTTPTTPWDCSQIVLTRAWELGGPGDQVLHGLLEVPGGDVIVEGTGFGVFDFGQGVAASMPAMGGAVVARLRSDGSPVWAGVEGGSIEQLASSEDGRFAIGGQFNGTLRLDIGTPHELSLSGQANYAPDGYVAILDAANGSTAWARTSQATPLDKELTNAVAIAADGTVWASGQFSGPSVTISYGEPDAITLGGGDSNSNYYEAWLAHFDHDGGLLGVASVTGEGDEKGLQLAPRPTGGVDWEVTAVSGDPITDLAGGITPVVSPGEAVLIRFGPNGSVEDQLAFSPAGALGWTYVGSDLTAVIGTAPAAGLPSWGGVQPVPIAGYPPYATAYVGWVAWPGGTGLPTSESTISWTGYGGPVWAGPAGRALAGVGGINTLLLYPETFQLKIQHNVTYESPLGNYHAFAAAEDPTGTWGCAVDVHTTAETSSLGFVAAVALDESGGLWMAGSAYNETLTFTNQNGAGTTDDTVAAQIVAADNEETEGWLARWQLWPATPPPAP